MNFEAPSQLFNIAVTTSYEICKVFHQLPAKGHPPAKSHSMCLHQSGNNKQMNKGLTVIRSAGLSWHHRSKTELQHEATEIAMQSITRPGSGAATCPGSQCRANELKKWWREIKWRREIKAASPTFFFPLQRINRSEHCLTPNSSSSEANTSSSVCCNQQQHWRLSS